MSLSSSMSSSLSSTPSFQIESYIQDWMKQNENRKHRGVRELFKFGLGRAPYFLKYTSDPSLSDTILIYPTVKSDLNDPIVQECNGLVLATDTWKVTAAGMPTMRHCTLNDFRNEMNRVDGVSTPAMEYAEDGTVLRVFYTNDRWYVSTNRRIDAHTATWASQRSFYDLMNDAVNETLGNTTVLEQVFDKELARNMVYSFVLTHPENYHVIHYPSAELILVSSRDMTTGVEVPITEANRVSFARLPTRPESVNDFLDNTVWDKCENKRGIIFSDWRNPMCVRRWIADRPSFIGARMSRKNMPSMELSYLANQTLEDQCAFRINFPSSCGMADQFDKQIEYLASDFQHIYRNSFILKKYFISPDDELYRVLRSVHLHYRKTREPIHLPHVVQIVRQQHPVFLLHLLTRKESEGRLVIANPLPREQGTPPLAVA